ncbi:MAG: hypothetical protein ASARMPREDX12_007857 [Alectoria sarmentosa]|nr:MAG: hypothetical protein ASARMPREDX12_007857 [Alectoria sarmentosa]
MSQKRVLAGPFDGTLSHQAVRELFVPYGKVRFGGWYHHIYGLTFGHVEFETESEAENAIQGLRNGSFNTYGTDIRMITAVALGRLPMGFEEWVDELIDGWTYEPMDADAGKKGKAAASPSLVRDNYGADVDMGDKSKAAESTSPGEPRGSKNNDSIDRHESEAAQKEKVEEIVLRYCRRMD